VCATASDNDAQIRRMCPLSPVTTKGGSVPTKLDEGCRVLIGRLPPTAGANQGCKSTMSEFWEDSHFQVIRVDVALKGYDPECFSRRTKSTSQPRL